MFFEVVTCQPAYFSVSRNMRHSVSFTWCSVALNNGTVWRFEDSEGLHGTMDRCLVIVPELGNYSFWTLRESRELGTKDEGT